MNIRITCNNRNIDTVSNHWDAMHAVMAAWEDGTLLPANVPHDITLYRSDDDGESYPDRTIALGTAFASCEIELDAGVYLTDEQVAAIQTKLGDKLNDICDYLSVTNSRIEITAVDRRFSARPNVHCRNQYEQIDQDAFAAIRDDAKAIEQAAVAAVQQYISAEDYELYSSNSKNYLDEEIDYRFRILDLENATVDELI